MAKKNVKVNPAKACKCDKCGQEVASAIPGKPHRKCGGQEGAASRTVGNYLPGVERGTWS